jgi:hypothetical protein
MRPSIVTFYINDVNAHIEHIPAREAPSGESGLHRRCPDFVPEPRRPIRPDKIAKAAHQIEVVFVFDRGTGSVENLAALQPDWSESSSTKRLRRCEKPRTDFVIQSLSLGQKIEFPIRLWVDFAIR